MQWMWLDWIFVVVLALSTVLACFRGFVKEAISLVTWIVAFLVALHFASTLGESIYASIHSTTVRFGLGFLSIFFVILILGMVVNILIGFLIKSTGFSVVDAMLGALFGFVRGGCLVLIILMFLAMPWLNASDLLDRSAIAGIMHPAVSWAMKHMPNKNAVTSSVENVSSTNPS